MLVLADAVFITAALYCAYVLRFERFFGQVQFYNALRVLPWVLAVYFTCYTAGGLYRVLWRYAGGAEVTRLALLSAAAGAVLCWLDVRFVWNISRGMLLIQSGIACALIGAGRLLWKNFLNNGFAIRRHRMGPRMMIVGAGMAGAYLVDLCKRDPSAGNPVLFVDNLNSKQGHKIHGVPVRGKDADIPQLAKKHAISDIVIAVPDIEGDKLNNLVALCKSTGCHVRVLMRMQNETAAGRNMFLRELNIGDFLSRKEIVLDTQGIEEYITGKVVLVTGGGGSIGSELCRQIIRFHPAKLIVFDIYENCAYELECELKRRYGKDVPVEVLIGSVREPARLKEVFGTEKPEVVFHAAAHKHVPLMEASPAEAVKNNVFGTKNVLEAAAVSGVKRFVLLSTDKAVNPTNVMGATKRVTEMLMQYYAKKTEMKCMAVRFGNVLGSHGSVIPLFESQIKAGGPVTVTHPDIIRYFMTIPEAAQLVLQAGAIARSGSVCVLDMGEPVRIDDLARQLIRFYGYEPGVTMDIVYTGLRPGEKLYEELLTDAEQGKMERTDHEKIMIAPTEELVPEEFEQALSRLAEAAQHNDAHVVEVLRGIVPGFHEDDRGK
ncbi:MAG: nucleoside-diphosphate sugar epimerase/dehydratase [Clostridia bacterium]|nr:nucleoside-diphosphate sugar epimerase/dehydratase [Clostridia bacterium]